MTLISLTALLRVSADMALREMRSGDDTPKKVTVSSRTALLAAFQKVVT